MATSDAAGSRKRRYDDTDDNGEVPFMSETGNKRQKSEATNARTSDEPANKRRPSLQDPHDSADEAAEDEVHDEDGDEDEDIGPYSEDREMLPNHPAFDKEVQDVRSFITKLTKGAAASVSDGTCVTAQVNELRKVAKDISVIPEPEPEMIGLLGEAGIGKSSLVNSLCDCPELAKAIDAGKSCTYVITKYKRAGPDQKLKFSFTVEFYDLHTIATLLSKALDDWYIFYFQPDGSWDEADKGLHESRATTCLSTFRAIFSNYEDFRSNGKARDMLDQLSRNEATRDEKVQNLAEQAERVLRSFEQRDGTYSKYFEANTTKALWKVLDDFITEGPDPDNPAPWPLVKQVSVGVKGSPTRRSRILDHYVLVDMPGISDTNELRIDATQQFLKQCDLLMVVVRAGRATSDPVVRSILRKYGKALDGNVMVICTMSDANITHELAIRMERYRISIGRYHAHKVRSDRLTAQIKELQAEKKKLAVGSNERNELLAQIDNRSNRKRRAENARWECVVLARNASNATVIQTEREKDMPDGKILHVFGISNKDYAKCVAADDPEGWQLSPKGTGVPALRYHLLDKATARDWNTLKDFISSKLTALVPSFEMWVRAGNPASGRAALIDVVQKQQQQVGPDFQAYQVLLMDLVEKHIIGPIRRKQTTHAESAVTYVKDTLTGHHYMTLQAFYKRKGHHRTPHLEASWNEEFTKLFKEALEGAWAMFTRARESAVAAMEEKTIAEVQSIIKKLRAGVREASGSSTATFEQGLAGHISAMRQAFRRRDQEFVKELRVGFMNATIDGKDNYFAKALEEAYETCMHGGGFGVKKRCLGRMTTHLSLTENRSPFAIMAATIKNMIRAATASQIKDLQSDLDIIFQAILRDVKAMVLKKPQDPSEKRVREKVTKWVEGGGALLEHIEMLMGGIEARYPAASL